MTHVCQFPRTDLWELVVGLEVHAQVSTSRKLFSKSVANFGADPNTQVSFIDAAMPGMLPQINKNCIVKAVLAGFGLNAKINQKSTFARKHYFYPDLPQGYQISQFDHPIIGEGFIDINIVSEMQDVNASTRRIGIERLHLEQDAGKSIHADGCTFVDLNRCGVALMEIVTKPDMRSSEEAVAFMKKLRAILRYLGVCDGDMERGSLRCDANVSVKRIDDNELGTRVEVKNINSFKNVALAIEYEFARQVSALCNNEKIIQETRLFDANSNETRSMRKKEEATDYRYFPDPDILDVVLTDEFIAKVKASVPELPDAKRNRYISEYGMSSYDSDVLVAEMEYAKYFEHVIAAGVKNIKMAANWIISELFGAVSKSDIAIDRCKFTPIHLVQLIDLIDSGTISGKMAKDVFAKSFEFGEFPKEIVRKDGLVQMNNVDELQNIINEIILANPKEVQGYCSGKDKLLAFFVGQVMKKTRGTANPQLVNDLLIKLLRSQQKN